MTDYQSWVLAFSFPHQRGPARLRLLPRVLRETPHDSLTTTCPLSLERAGVLHLRIYKGRKLALLRLSGLMGVLLSPCLFLPFPSSLFIPQEVVTWMKPSKLPPRLPSLESQCPSFPQGNLPKPASRRSCPWKNLHFPSRLIPMFRNTQHFHNSLGIEVVGFIQFI